MKTKRSAAFSVYIGYGEEAITYLDELKALAAKENKTLSDFVLDAVELYVKAKTYKPKEEPQIAPAGVPKPTPKAPAPLTRSIVYDDLEDPPMPQVDVTQIPSSKPN